MNVMLPHTKSHQSIVKYFKRNQVVFLVLFFISCATSMSPARINEALPDLTTSKFISQIDAEEAIELNKCKYLIESRSYLAPIGFTVKNDLKNAARGIDEWIEIDGGNAYTLISYKWITVDDKGSTQLSVDFNTMLCSINLEDRIHYSQAGNTEGEIDDRGGRYGSHEGLSNGTSLQMTGWKWDFRPSPNDKSLETGQIVYRITIDNEGYIIKIELQSSTVSPSVERIYRQSVEQLSFSKTGNYKPAPTSSGTITFLIQSK